MTWSRCKGETEQQVLVVQAANVPRNNADGGTKPARTRAASQSESKEECHCTQAAEHLLCSLLAKVRDTLPECGRMPMNFTFTFRGKLRFERLSITELLSCSKGYCIISTFVLYFSQYLLCSKLTLLSGVICVRTSGSNYNSSYAYVHGCTSAASTSLPFKLI